MPRVLGPIAEPGKTARPLIHINARHRPGRLGRPKTKHMGEETTMTTAGTLFLALALGAATLFSGVLLWGVHVTKPKH